MSVELYLFLLMLSVIFTIGLTWALKRLLNKAGVPYRANAVVLDSAMLSSTLVSVMLKNHLNLGLSFSATQVTRLLLVILSTWLASMLVYDKAIQTREQYRRYRKEKVKEKVKVKEKEKNAKELRIQKISEHSNVDEGGGSQSGQDDGTDSGGDNRNDSNDGSC